MHRWNVDEMLCPRCVYRLRFALSRASPLDRPSHRFLIVRRNSNAYEEEDDIEAISRNVDRELESGWRY